MEGVPRGGSGVTMCSSGGSGVTGHLQRRSVPCSILEMKFTCMFMILKLPNIKHFLKRLDFKVNSELITCTIDVGLSMPLLNNYLIRQILIVRLPSNVSFLKHNSMLMFAHTWKIQKNLGRKVLLPTD